MLRLGLGLGLGIRSAKAWIRARDHSVMAWIRGHSPISLTLALASVTVGGQEHSTLDIHR